MVDWEKEANGSGPPIGHRISIDEVKAMFEITGYKLSKEMQITAVFHGLLAVKK